MMTYASSAQKTARTTARTASPDAAAGPKGIAIAPPAYGIDVVDRAPVASVSAPAREPQGTSPSLFIQAKLTVGPVGDKYEQAADRVATQVVNAINRPDANPSVPRETGAIETGEALQMKPHLPSIGHEGGAVSRDLESDIPSAKGGGQALAPSLQRSMEQAIGADFGGVKIHTDARSDQLNRSLQAKAFTTGQDVFFRKGAYNPGSKGGQELIAHELTHVVQQSGNTLQRARATLVQRKPDDEPAPADQSEEPVAAGGAAAPAKGAWQPDLTEKLPSMKELQARGPFANKVIPPKSVTPKKPRQREAGMANLGKLGQVTNSPLIIRPGDKYTIDTGAALVPTAPVAGEIIANHQIPVLANALGFPGVTAKDLMGERIVRYWVVDPKGVAIAKLGGFEMRPVIMMSDVLASGVGVVGGTTVYRGDQRGPIKGYPRSTGSWDSSRKGILETGFRAWLTDQDLWLHQMGYNNDDLSWIEERTSAYVSTTTSIVKAAQFAGDAGFLYTMKVPQGIKIGDALGPWRNSQYDAEMEISVPFGIDPGHITKIQDVADPTAGQTVDIKTPQQLKKWIAKIHKSAAKKADPEKQAAYYQKAVGARQAITTPEENQEKFLAKTGGGGGGLHGIDWKLISMAKEWLTFAELYQQQNVKQKIAMLNKEKLLKQLQAQVPTIEPEAAVAEVDQALPALVAQAPAAAAPTFGTIKEILRANAMVIAPSDELVRSMELLRSELQFKGKTDAAKYVDGLRKTLAKGKKLTINPADHERLEELQISLRGAQFGRLKDVIAAGAEKVGDSDALDADLDRIAQQLTNTGFATDAKYLQTLRAQLATGSLELKPTDHKRLTYIYEGLGVHQ